MINTLNAPIAFDSTAMSSTNVRTSSGIDLAHYCRASAHLVWTGTATGTFKLQGSNDNSNWADIASATYSVSAAGNAFIVLNDVSYRYVRAVYTNATNTGTIGTCILHAKAA